MAWRPTAGEKNIAQGCDGAMDKEEARTASLRAHLLKGWKTGFNSGHGARAEGMKLGAAGR